MTSWHIITSEYPPDVGGVSDYTHQVAETLARDGEEVHVWCPPNSEPRTASNVHVHTELGRFGPSDLRALGVALNEFAPPRRLLVQWVPHGYGYRSMNLWFCMWLARRASKGDRVELVVHEPFVELKPWPPQHIVLAVVHRLMTMVLMCWATRVWVTIPAWESKVRPYALGRRVCIDWLPVPACVAPSSGSKNPPSRTTLDVETPLVGHFGTYGEVVTALLSERLPAIMESRSRPSLYLIGAHSESFRAVLVARYPAWNARVHATGYVPSSELMQHLDACDLLLQPYPDGITSRRTSVMACLSRARPVVTTCGHLTEAFWAPSRAVVLAPVSDPDAFVSAALQLLNNPEERMQVGRRGLDLYQERFTVDGVAAALRVA